MTHTVHRTAVRAIVFHDDLLLTITSQYGDYKFPGGGQEEGENIPETLIREVQEETGYQVIPSSLSPYLLVHERRPLSDDTMMYMESYYFYAAIKKDQGERHLDPYEKDYGYQIAWLPLSDAITHNSQVEKDARLPWVTRELTVMRRLSQSDI